MVKLHRISNLVIEYGFYLLFFLVPLFMTPFNYELFEFNKMILVYFLGTFIVSGWLLKMVLQKKIIFQKTFWTLPLIFFLLSQFLSFWISIDRHTSFWGYYSRFHGGLLSTITYFLLFSAFVSNFKDFNPKRFLLGQKIIKNGFVSNCLLAILTSAFLVTAYGIAEHFGIDADFWVQDVKNRVFSSLGQPNWLAAYLVSIIPLSWALVLKTQNKKERTKGWFFFLPHFLFLIFYLTLLYTKSRSGILAFGGSFFIFWGLTFWPFLKQKGKLLKKMPQEIKGFLIILASFLIVTVLVGTPWTPTLQDFLIEAPSVLEKETVNQPPLHISESSEIREVVWRGAINIWQKHPILGTGPETFAHSYYWYRPRKHNDLSEWDFLYNKAHNEFLNFAATTGSLGLIAYLTLIFTYVFYTLKNHKKPLIRAFLAGFIGILITNFFGFSVVAVALLFFLFPALSFSLTFDKKVIGNVKAQKLTKLTYSHYLGLGLVFLLFLFSQFSILKVWYVDFVFAKGEKFEQAGQYKLAFEKIQQATQLKPSEPLYHNALSLTASQLALSAYQQDKPELANQLSVLAENESNWALKISPFHLNYWKNRTRVFYALSEIDEIYNQKALESLLEAAKLSPTDAKIYYNLGLLYASTGQKDKAIETLEKTIDLKPNYADARYALALFYEQEGEIEKAKKQLEYILEQINPLHQSAGEKLEKLN